MRLPKVFRQFLAVLAIVGAASSLHGVTITVTSLADSGEGTLRQAIAVSLSGGTIEFAVKGTVTLTTELVIGRNLTILGPGPQLLTIDANQKSRVFNVMHGAVVDISGMTVMGGLYVAERMFDEAYGGGVKNAGVLYMSNIQIIGNGVSNVSPPHDSLGHAWGGAIENDVNATIVLTTCRLSDNYAIGLACFGGAIYNPKGGTLVLRGCTLNDNRAGDRKAALGGAIYNNGTALITHCTFERNRAETDTSSEDATNRSSGGAIYSLTDGDIEITSCTIVSNSCVGYSKDLDSRAAEGGGISNPSHASLRGSVLLRNTIVAGNMVSNAYSLPPGLQTVRGPDVAGEIVSQGFNLIGMKDDSVGWVATDLVGNSAAPLDPLLGPLMDNGGPTPTMAPRPGSGAIDNGHSFGTALDQRGLPRSADLVAYPNASGGDGTDIGAVEVQFEYVPVDIGLRASEGSHTIRIACEPPDAGGGLTSRLRIRKGTTTYGIILVEPDSTEASKIKIKTPSGIKAWRKLP